MKTLILNDIEFNRECVTRMIEFIIDIMISSKKVKVTLIHEIKIKRITSWIKTFMSFKGITY